VTKTGRMNSEIAVSAENVSKSFDSQRVLENVSFSLVRGSTLVVLGASGSGKSVMMSLLVGLMYPDEGTITVLGEEVTSFRRESDWTNLRLKIGFLFQGSALYDSMTLAENVAFPLVQHSRQSGDEIERRVTEKLSLVGLAGAEGKMPAELSGGMQKRAGLARALALDPELVIYDEPTTGLDPMRADSISRLIRRLQNELHNTAIVVTHDIACAYTVADTMVLLHNGRIIAEGTADYFKTCSDEAVRQFVSGSSEGPLEMG